LGKPDPTASICVYDPTCLVAGNHSLYTRYHVEATFNFMGCKPAHSTEITLRLFKYLRRLQPSGDDTIVRGEVSRRFPIRSSKAHLIAALSRPHYFTLIKAGLAHLDYTKPEQLADFCVASDIKEQKRSCIILLSGTSGTGKSTLASLLAKRLGITKVVSTDTIRHTLRRYIPREQSPYLFGSTYEVGGMVSPVTGAFGPSSCCSPHAASSHKDVGNDNSLISEKQVKRRHKQQVLLGHHLQSECVVNHLVCFLLIANKQQTKNNTKLLTLTT
jgi:hypothetical protein